MMLQTGAGVRDQPVKHLLKLSPSIVTWSLNPNDPRQMTLTSQDLQKVLTVAFLKYATSVNPKVSL